MTDEPRWWCCELSNGRFIGRAFATRSELRAAFNCDVHDNGLCTIFAVL